MALSDKITKLLQDNGFTVSEWLLPSSRPNMQEVKPPYAVVQDVEGHGVYANGKLVIPVEAVNVHFVYRGVIESDEELLSKLKKLLEPYGSEWKKEKFSAERVMLCTFTMEG